MTAAILFDLDDTLLDRTGSLGSFLAAQYGRFSDRLGDVGLARWRDRFLEFDAHGAVSKAFVYDALIAEFGGERRVVRTLLSDYRRGCRFHARAFPGMRETLAALRRRGFALGIVTNGEVGFQRAHIDALGLDRLVDAILISEQEGLRKPDPALFWRAARRLAVAPEECLFVGDHPVADVLGAHVAGMDTAWFHAGRTWPAVLPPLPGEAIGALGELLDLPRFRAGDPVDVDWQRLRYG